MTRARAVPAGGGSAGKDRTIARALLLAAGTVCVGLGVLGIVVPLLPTTPFLLLAAACFARSSDRFLRWLLDHRWFGAHIRNYREHRATTRAVKVSSVTMLWASVGYAALFHADNWPVRALLLAVAAGVTAHLLCLKTMTSATSVTSQQGSESERREAEWQTPSAG